MIVQLVTNYLNELGYQFNIDSKVFEELESIHFVNLLAYLNEQSVNVNLALFNLDTDATLGQFVKWIENVSKEL